MTDRTINDWLVVLEQAEAVGGDWYENMTRPRLAVMRELLRNGTSIDEVHFMLEGMFDHGLIQAVQSQLDIEQNKTKVII